MCFAKVTKVTVITLTQINYVRYRTPPDLPAEFDEVAAELGRTLDFFKVPKREKAEVLAAFAAHKDEVTAGYVAAAKRG